MKVTVDRDLCEANAVCEKHCPEVFSIDDDEELVIDSAAIRPELLDALADAVRLCPRGALEIVRDAEDGE